MIEILNIPAYIGANTRNSSSLSKTIHQFTFLTTNILEPPLKAHKVDLPHSYSSAKNTVRFLQTGFCSIRVPQAKMTALWIQNNIYLIISNIVLSDKTPAAHTFWKLLASWNKASAARNDEANIGHVDLLSYKTLYAVLASRGLYRTILVALHDLFTKCFRKLVSIHF